MHGDQDEWTGFGQRQRFLRGLCIGDIADRDHVWPLAQCVQALK